MRFGCCGSLVASGPDRTGVEIVERLAEYGYDYIELPLAEMMELDGGAFGALRARVEATSLRCETCNNFFPARVRLTGPEADLDAARGYGATDFISYKDGPIGEQVLAMTDGKGVDKVLIAGGDVDTFKEAVIAVKPGGKIGNVNYLGSGDYIDIPRVEWGVGMGHKEINGGLMPGGRLRMEKLASLVTCGRLDLKPLLSHVFHGWDHLEEALFLMRDKPADLIKPVVVIEED